MPKPTIEQIRAVGDLAVRYNWQLRFSKLPSGTGMSAEEIDIRCLSTKLPSSGNGNVQVNNRGAVHNQPGQGTYGETLPLTLYEGVDLKVANFLKNWRELCWQTGTGYQAPMAQREAEILLFLLNLQNQPIRQYKLIGCYLEANDPGSLDNSNDVIQHSVTLRYDYFVEG